MLCSRYLASSRLLCILLDSYNPSTAFLASPKLLCLLLRLLVCHFQSFYSFFFLHLPEVHLGFLGLFQTVFTILGISAATLLSPAFFFPTPGLFAVILLASVLSEQLQWYSLLSYWTFRISAAFLSSPRFVVYSPWFFFAFLLLFFCLFEATLYSLNLLHTALMAYIESTSQGTFKLYAFFVCLVFFLLKTLGYSGDPLISVMLSSYTWGSSVFSWWVICLVDFFGLWHSNILFPLELTFLLSSRLLHFLCTSFRLCCFVGLCLFSLFCLGFANTWGTIMWSLSISVFHQFFWFLWDFWVPFHYFLLSEATLYSLGHLQIISYIARPSKTICWSLQIFQTYFFFNRIFCWRKMR